MEHWGNGDHRSRGLALARSNDFRGTCGRLKNYRRTQQRRNEQRHELPEDVAERHERNEAQRMKPTLMLAIGFDAALERLEIRQEIPVRQHHAASLGGWAAG